MITIFIDGQSGTTGLQIYDRIANLKEFTLLSIPEKERKNTAVKKEIYDQADLVVLCLPDQAAREAVQLIGDSKTKILDASTAHRVSDDWAYGLPELNPSQREAIRHARLVSNPGCYPTGFLLALAPLVEEGIVPADYPVCVNAVSGYSGGGKALIEKYENQALEEAWPFRPYALTLQHKHLPEMHKYAGLDHPPLFVPSVGHFYNGMLVMIPLKNDLLGRRSKGREIHDVWQARYGKEPFVEVIPFADQTFLEEGFLSPVADNGTNRIDLFVFGNDEQTLLVARLDNLGKGASGAAVQNMNLMFGLDETTGLI